MSDLESILNNNGYFLTKNSKHKIFSNGRHSIPVPHCRELNKFLAKKILRQIQVPARQYEQAA